MLPSRELKLISRGASVKIVERAESKTMSPWSSVLVIRMVSVGEVGTGEKASKRTPPISVSTEMPWAALKLMSAVSVSVVGLSAVMLKKSEPSKYTLAEGADTTKWPISAVTSIPSSRNDCSCRERPALMETRSSERISALPVSARKVVWPPEWKLILSSSSFRASTFRIPVSASAWKLWSETRVRSLVDTAIPTPAVGAVLSKVMSPSLVKKTSSSDLTVASVPTSVLEVPSVSRLSMTITFASMV
mmetsp:Transcript_4912/g.17533  ORF Transcript_4912/g.17533 Transcript_4912/m.17533 type:complete len:247 (+) Transcript_4912:3497-4237(+)